MDDGYLEKGLEQRKATLGGEYVDNVFANADDFSRPFQEAMTAWCWGFGWGDDVFSPKMRSMLNLPMLAALNRMEEFELHFRGAIRNGVTKDELRGLLHIISIYAGVPAGVSSFRIAKKVFAEEGM